MRPQSLTDGPTSHMRCLISLHWRVSSSTQDSPKWEWAMAVAMAQGRVMAGVMVKVKAELAQLLRRAGTAHWSGCRHGLCE